MHRVLARQIRSIGIGDGPPNAEQWAYLLERIDRAYVEADQDRYTLERALDLSSAEMRKRFTELRAAQNELVLASRRAGMADVATNVLHNIGNVLNSVSVSIGVLLELTETPGPSALAKSVELLAKQAAPGRFLDEDPRGKRLVAYLGAVSESLAEERAEAKKELTSLTKNLDHIRKVVGQQLAVVRGDIRGTRVFERVNLAELIDDAITVARSRPTASSTVDLVRVGDAIAIETDRHSLFQIVMNLVTNACDALKDRSGRVTIELGRRDDGLVTLSVADDGVGIAPADLERVFVHGFTTKANGHGFGLHSSACAAVELGGKLSVASEGPGKGAVFTLVLPATRSRALPREEAA